MNKEQTDILRKLSRVIYSGTSTISELAELLKTDEQTLIDEISKVDEHFESNLNRLKELDLD